MLDKLISNIIFEGNDDIKDEQLQESLDGNGVRIGDPLDKTVLTSIENGLKDFFYSIGKYNADVTAIITPLPRNRVDLKLLFEEGDAAEIEQINTTRLGGISCRKLATSSKRCKETWKRCVTIT